MSIYNGSDESWIDDPRHPAHVLDLVAMTVVYLMVSLVGKPAELLPRVTGT